MSVPLLLSVLFAAGAVANFATPPVNLTEAVACTAISLLMVVIILWIRKSHRKSQQTYIWLRDNDEEITDEPNYFQDGPVFDMPISRKTRLRSFKIVTSALIISSTVELGMEIRKGIWAGLFATAWTLIFGWWAFPWGPIQTIRALHHNLTGGQATSVAGAILYAKTGVDFENSDRFS